jgi:RecA-family ATPase
LDEPFERIKLMEKFIKPDMENLIFDKEIQKYDLKDKDGQNQMLLRLAELTSVWHPLNPHVVVIDPIYAVVSGGLNGDVEVHLVNKFIRTIQNRHNCAVVYMHHTNRGQKKENSKDRHDGDMYGSRFLSANLTGQFHLKKTDDGIELHNVKNTYGNLLKNIPLIYDELSQTLSMSGESGDFNKRDKILMFLRKKHSERKEFALREISNYIKVSDAYIRKTLNPMIRTGHIVNKAIQGTKAVYFVEKSV